MHDLSNALRFVLGMASGFPPDKHIQSRQPSDAKGKFVKKKLALFPYEVGSIWSLPRGYAAG
jgi:hypothetical protein